MSDRSLSRNKRVSVLRQCSYLRETPAPPRNLLHTGVIYRGGEPTQTWVYSCAVEKFINLYDHHFYLFTVLGGRVGLLLYFVSLQGLFS